MGGHTMSASVLFDVPGPRAKTRSRIFSVITVLIVVVVLTWAVMSLAAPRQSSGITIPGYFDGSRWAIFADPLVWQAIGEGLLATLKAAAAAAAMALIVGIAFALLRTSIHPGIRIPTTIVLEFLRGMPVLLLMFFILITSSWGTYWSVVLGLGLYNGAIIGEALRAGLASLPRGQREAGLSIGLTRLQTKTYIEFPQAFRQMLPIIVAQLVVLLKDTSLGYIVGYNELIRVTMNQLAAFYGNRYLLSLFFVTLVIYLLVNLALSAFARRLARGPKAPKARNGGQLTPTVSISTTMNGKPPSGRGGDKGREQ